MPQERADEKAQKNFRSKETGGKNWTEEKKTTLKISRKKNQ